MSSVGRPRLSPEAIAEVRARVRNPVASILGVLYKPLSIAAIARLSGVPPVECATTLEALVTAGRVKKTREPGQVAELELFDRVLEIP